MPDEHHLVIDVSGHGYGHAGVSVSVLNAIWRRRPGLKVTIRSTITREWFAGRIEGPFDILQRQFDFGMMMADARKVLPEESMNIYADIHSDWPATVIAAAKELVLLKPTLVIANISYLSIAAAKYLGCPAIAFGSLNWADIFRYYCGHLPGAGKVFAEMVQSYAAVEKFLQTTPFMPMPSIGNGHPVGPVAAVGRDRKCELRRRLNVGERTLVLIAVRGGPNGVQYWNWPRLNDMCVIVGPTQIGVHPDVICSTAVDFPFIDLVSSCDVLITKPGYGLVTEAACNGTPILLIPWQDWPETVGLTSWFNEHGRMLTLSDEKLCLGDFATEVQKLLSLPIPPRPAPNGVLEIAGVIEDHMPSP